MSTTALAYLNATAAGAGDELLAQLSIAQLRDLARTLARQLVVDESAPGHPHAVVEVTAADVCGQADQLAAHQLRVPVEAITTPNRHRPVADARAVAQAVARNLGLSLPAIAAHYGQHHTTVLHSVQKVAGSPRLCAAATQITHRLLETYGAHAA